LTPSITRYIAPRWLPGGHAQTIWPLLRKGPLPDLRRERWDTPDGDFIDLDWLPHRPGAPLVVLFHGLEGSSESPYARSLMRMLTRLGWNGVVPHFRGCSGEPNRLPRAYHSGDADEIGWILERLATLHPQLPRYAAGVSLGGNALLLWLGTRGRDACQTIHAAAAVCPPLDMAAAGHNLSKGFNRLYTRHFLATLKHNAAAKLRQHPELFDLEAMLRTTNLYEFDNLVTAPLHGFRDTDDYWHRASSKAHLKEISIPTLVINPLNDPFLPASFLPSRKDVSSFVTLEQPEEGGHVGFVSGGWPGHLDWLPGRLVHFFTISHNS
jgi:predicted alpha/beta-fold hydrolase